MGLQKQDIPVGVKVRGWGLLNEYGQFDFTPEQTGVRQGKVKKVAEGDNYSISETKDRVIIHCSFKKKETNIENVVEYTKIFDLILNILRNYDF